MTLQQVDPLAGQSTGSPFTLIKYLTNPETYNPGYASVAELRRYGAMAKADREIQTARTEITLRPNYTNELRKRLVDLIRHQRYFGQIEAADFLTGLFARLDGDSALVGREIALQRAAEKKIAEAVERWTENLLRFADPVALTNVAELMENDKSRQINAGRAASFAAAFGKATAHEASEAAIKDMYDRSQALISAAVASGHSAAAKQLEDIRADLEAKLGLKKNTSAATGSKPGAAPPQKSSPKKTTSVKSGGNKPGAKRK